MIKELQQHQIALDALPLYEEFKITSQPITTDFGLIARMSSRGLATESALSNVIIIREGKNITLRIPSMILSTIDGSATTINLFTGSNLLPDRFIPDEPMIFPYIFSESGVYGYGFIKIVENRVTFTKLDGSVIGSGFSAEGASITYVAK